VTCADFKSVGPGRESRSVGFDSHTPPPPISTVLSIDNPEKRTETPVRSTVERLRAEAYGSAFSSALIPAPDRFLLALSSAFLHVMGGAGTPGQENQLTASSSTITRCGASCGQDRLRSAICAASRATSRASSGTSSGSMSSGMVCLITPFDKGSKFAYEKTSLDDEFSLQPRDGC